jgi:nucleoside-diphosphate-sugar epimerase
MLRSDAGAGAPEPGAWAVTGASGYLGSRLVRELRARGRRVVALGRRPAADPAAEHRAFALGAAPPAGALDGVEVLVHAAYDFSVARPHDVRRVNVDGSIRLLDEAARRGVRIAHVSSLSAFPGCRSLYGRAKLAVEEATAERSGAVVRPGLIYGRDAGGMVGAMTAAVRTLPAVPLVGSGGWVQFTGHVADVVRLVLHAAAAAAAARPGVLVAASEQPRTLREIVEVLARANGRRRLLVPVPVPVLFAALRAAELARVPLRTRADSLVGLVHGGAAPDFGPTRATGVTFRPFDETTVGQDA